MNGLALSIAHNYTYILPWWRLAYDPAGYSAETATIEPLSFLFDVHKLSEFLAGNGEKLIADPW